MSPTRTISAFQEIFLQYFSMTDVLDASPRSSSHCCVFSDKWQSSAVFVCEHKRSRVVLGIAGVAGSLHFQKKLQDSFK